MRTVLLRLLGLTLLLAFVPGCVRETANGGVLTVTYDWWVTGIALIAGLVAGLMGWQLWQWSPQRAWGLLLVGPILVIFFAPSVFLDRVTVRPDGFSQRGGIWGMTVVTDVKFGNVRRIVITAKERRRGLRKVREYVLVCERPNGGASVSVNVNNDVIGKALPKILQYAVDHGIEVVDER